MSVKEIFKNKDQREQLEIDMFLKKYNKKDNSDFRIFIRREKPDYFIKNSNNEILGIELTSVYMDGKVVKDEHLENNDKDIPYDIKTHEHIRNTYFKRIIDKINEKAKKVKENKYDATYPIILSVYLNDYYTIHINSSEWLLLKQQMDSYFRQRNEFKEVFLIK